MVFFSPNMGSVVAVASQGRFFLLFRILAHKGHIWSKKVISGPDFLKNDDIWSDFIKLDLILDFKQDHMLYASWDVCFCCLNSRDTPHITEDDEIATFFKMSDPKITKYDI